jgi:hypothetical protein
MERCRRFCSRSYQFPLVGYHRKHKTPAVSSFKDLLAVGSWLRRSKVGSIFEEDSADLAVTACDIGKSTGACYMAVQRALCCLQESFAVMGGLTTSPERSLSDGNLRYSAGGLTGQGSFPVPRSLR